MVSVFLIQTDKLTVYLDLEKYLKRDFTIEEITESHECFL